MKFAVYCGGNNGNQSAYIKTAEQLGIWMAKKQHALVYGGGKAGLMGALADAMLANQGDVLGVMPQFLVDREIAHTQLGNQLHIVDSMSTRKQMMLDKSDICLALPGGPGTLEEIVEAISWLRVGQSQNPCVFLNVNQFYDHLKTFFKHMVAEGFLTPEDHQRIVFVDSLAELEDWVSTQSFA